MEQDKHAEQNDKLTDTVSSVEADTTEESQEEERKERKWWILLFLLILLIGVCISIVILGSRLKEQAQGDDVINLLPEDGADVEDSDDVSGESTSGGVDTSGTEGDDSEGNGEENEETTTSEGQTKTLYASLTTGGGVQIWTSQTQVELFKSSYYGSAEALTADQITVQSADGAKVIAPGTGNTYEFWVKNSGDVPMDYLINFEPDPENDSGVPLRFKLRSGDEYIFGSADTWVSWAELCGVDDKKTILPKHYINYVLEWSWVFDEDVDWRDNYFGNQTVMADMKQSIVIKTEGTISEGYTATWKTGGLQTGDDSNVTLWIILAVLSLLALTGYTKGKKGFRKDEKEK